MRQTAAKGATGEAEVQKSASPPSRSSAEPPPASTVRFPPDWSELIGLLSAHRVRFLIVGAHALAIAGRPRATQDLDLFVEPTVENAERLGAALEEFGFSQLSRESHRFAEPERMARLGSPPLQIDIMTSIAGLSFQDAWNDRQTVAVGTTKAAVLSRQSLLTNKRAAGRAKDLADIALLLESDEE
jgi:hypothetical protein